MSKAGLIDSPTGGRFITSAAGRALLARKPKAIGIELLRTYPSYTSFIANTPGATPSEGAATEAAAASFATPEEQIDAAYSVLNAAVRVELLQRIMSNTPAFFERVIVDLLVGMGYGGSMRTPQCAWERAVMAASMASLTRIG